MLFAAFQGRSVGRWMRMLKGSSSTIQSLRTAWRTTAAGRTQIELPKTLEMQQSKCLDTCVIPWIHRDGITASIHLTARAGILQG